MNILVSNLSLNTLDGDLRKLFAAFGEVHSAIVTRDKLNGRSKGTARVQMLNHAQGDLALLALNKTMVHGKTIKLSEIRYSPNDYSL